MASTIIYRSRRYSSDTSRSISPARYSTRGNAQLSDRYGVPDESFAQQCLQRESLASHGSQLYSVARLENPSLSSHLITFRSRTQGSIAKRCNASVSPTQIGSASGGLVVFDKIIGFSLLIHTRHTSTIPLGLLHWLGISYVNVHAFRSARRLHFLSLSD